MLMKTNQVLLRFNKLLFIYFKFTESYKITHYFHLFSYIIMDYFHLFYYHLQQVLSYPFYPVAWLMGIEWDDVPAAAQLLALKLAANEFVAYSQFVTMTVREQRRVRGA
jgi:nucleoside permease NupC